MKYAVYIGNYRIDKDVKRIAVLDSLDEALDIAQDYRNKGQDAYVREAKTLAYLPEGK